MTRPARAALQVLLDADGEELYVKQIAARAELALGTGWTLRTCPDLDTHESRNGSMAAASADCRSNR